MDNSISDNKLNMSLDDIIKKERKVKQQKSGSMQGTARKRVASARINTLRGKRSMAVRSVTRRNRQQNALKNGLSTAIAMKVVNKLVKKAIQRRTNQSLINRAVTLRRRAIRQKSALRPAGRGLRARRQAAIAGSRLAGRLSGVSQRSRVIRGSLARNARRQPVMFTSPQVVRGRGLSHMGQLASDSEAFMIGQREIARPAMARQPHREVIMRRRARPIIVEQQPVIIRRGGIRKRTVLNQPSVVVVRNAPRQTQFRTLPEFGRVQRVVGVSPRNRIIRKMQYVNPNAAQMRKALGIGVRRSEPQRFEPSSTFLQRIPASTRRGRGFQNVLYN